MTVGLRTSHWSKFRDSVQNVTFESMRHKNRKLSFKNTFFPGFLAPNGVQNDPLTFNFLGILKEMRENLEEL